MKPLFIMLWTLRQTDLNSETVTNLGMEAEHTSTWHLLPAHSNTLSQDNRKNNVRNRKK